MKTSLTIPFSGFYNSLWSEELEQVLERNFEYDNGHLISDRLFDRAQDSIDWKKAFIDLSKSYVEAFKDHFELKTLEFETLDSPQYYNFTTDRIFCFIDSEEVKQIHKYMTSDDLRLAKLKETIEENHTSRSGFCSFYPNSLEDWPEDISEWDSVHLATLLQSYIEIHENFEDGEWDMSIYYRLSENNSFDNAIDGATKDPKPFNIAYYLRERSDRKYRSKAA